MATKLLEKNTLNRPLNDAHVERIKRQIEEGKWKFNGETIKVAKTGDVVDGQHRLWACVYANRSIETIVVYGLEKDAFETVDTLRKTRSGSDVLAVAGLEKYRSVVASALRWLLLYQRKVIPEHHMPVNRIENSDIVEMYAAHPGIVRAVERCTCLRPICNSGILSFIYYIVSNRDPELAERMVSTMFEPGSVSMNDPFIMLRQHFLSVKRQRGATHSAEDIALAIKAFNAAKKGERIKSLKWQSQGSKPELFPELNV